MAAFDARAFADPAAPGRAGAPGGAGAPGREAEDAPLEDVGDAPLENEEAAGGGVDVTIAFLPAGTDPGQLARDAGFALGAMSAGIGSVAPAQTYLDIGQGNRAFDSLYPRGLPLLYIRGERVPTRIWSQVLARAEDVPADIVPGLLASTLADAGTPISAARHTGAPSLLAVDREGSILRAPECVDRPCEGMTVVEASPARARALAGELAPEDLLLAIERPSSTGRRLLTIGIAGGGFEGLLTSDSTRMGGYVLSTDIGPTLLERAGAEVPGEMSGSAISSEGEADPGQVVELEERLGAISPRRTPVVGANLLAWTLAAVLAALALGRRGARVALELLALSAAYLPLLLLAGAALTPSELGERLLVGLGAPGLAVLTRSLIGGYGALAVAALATVLAHAVDVVAGSPLTALSVIGPNPALGVRFFGIGNELEAALAVLTLAGVGAALAAWWPADGRRAALAFAVAALLGVAAFAPGRFGADVGAAIVFPAGAAVAAAVALRARRSGLLALIAAPVIALAALLAADLVLGGDAHLSRSVLEAGGLEEVGEVIERRLRLSATSFASEASRPYLWIALALIVAAIVQARRIISLFAGQRLALAGYGGAAAATLVGTVANDSGALLLMIGTAYLALIAGFAWARTQDAPTEAELEARRREPASGESH